MAASIVAVNVRTDEVRSFRGSPEPLAATASTMPDPGGDGG
jgi:hypothetical protein